VTSSTDTAVTFSGEDWYGEELGARAFTDCTFRDVDLTGAVLVAGARGAVVEP
jgi:hypothetical protein